MCVCVLYVCYTAYYTAPEVLKGRYDRAADIWSVGVILFCMLYGFPPFYVDKTELVAGQKEEEAIFKLIEGGFDPTIKKDYGPWFPEDLSENVSQNARNLIGDMLKTDTSTRITVIEALSHPWIRGQANDRALPRTVFSSLLSFTNTCRFKLLVSRMFAKVYFLFSIFFYILYFIFCEQKIYVC